MQSDSARALIRIVLISGCFLPLGACIYSTANTVATSAAVDEVSEEQAFEAKATSRYRDFLQAAEQSGCSTEDYALNPEVVEFIRETGDSSIEETQERLTEVATHTAAPDSERADALYHLAVISSERLESNEVLALEYLDIMESDYPDTRSCARDWLRERIQKRRAQALQTLNAD